MQIKKHRKQERLFLVEGAKSISELLDSDYKTRSLFLTEYLYNCCADKVEKLKDTEVVIVSENELIQAGTFESNNAGIAIVEMKENLKTELAEGELALVLDDIRDPGNLGTIIRIADWYGISKLYCSENTAEFYNPKVIASSMGSFTRVMSYYSSLEVILDAAKMPVYGAVLEGKSVHSVNFIDGGYLIMGNESRGISENLKKYVQYPVTIPKYGAAESLNVGIATAVILDNARRNIAV